MLRYGRNDELATPQNSTLRLERSASHFGSSVSSDSYEAIRDAVLSSVPGIVPHPPIDMPGGIAGTEHPVGARARSREAVSPSSPAMFCAQGLRLFRPTRSRSPSNYGDFGMNGRVSVEYQFEGKTAHSAGMPWEERSALDAVELTNIS